MDGWGPDELLVQGPLRRVQEERQGLDPAKASVGADQLLEGRDLPERGVDTG